MGRPGNSVAIWAYYTVYKCQSASLISSTCFLHNVFYTLLIAHLSGVDSCYLEVMRRWLDSEGLQPTTWATFIEILEDMNLPELSKDVHRALHYRLDRS